MGRRGKLEKYAAVAESPNVIESGNEWFEKIKGHWNSDFFRKSQPVTLELGCGYGEYTVGLARVFPNRNFIGVDIKGARIWKGSKEALEEDLHNVGFLRLNIIELPHFFDEGEVDEIWVTFPDPRPKSRDEKRRLVSHRYLKLYAEVLKPGGLVHLKTDNTFLFEYTMELLGRLNADIEVHTFDLYCDDQLFQEHHGLKTRYEKKFKDAGESIKYIRFRMNDAIKQDLIELDK